MSQPAYTGVDGLYLATDDLDAARRFQEDWGLTALETTDPAVLRHRTADGTEVQVRLTGDPALPPAMEEGPTLRLVIWGVEGEGDLDLLRERLGGDAFQIDGMLAVRDPNGLCHAFRVCTRQPVIADQQSVNGPGRPNRVDARSPVYERATPLSIGHVVLFIDDLDKTFDFFLGTLGFVVSDSYPGHAAFLRARTPGPHHDAFVLRRPGNPGLNHIAYTVSNIHEVFGGGIGMAAKGWETSIGPGRHPISSAYFWYFKSPFGAALEYYADDDWCTEDWVAGEFERTPENFTEWALSAGIDPATRRETKRG